ncbi:phage tail protein [Streptomyces sp. NBC_01373]|uniref:phage tail protein n=1 Tax=Streptomyces sp. NBC_01373 TaxID=2903843 RepID=UPI002253DDE9|nr:phage tail protein [Streptomyces sp. NBC_01373]MCX4705643.1 phage tail protein [Streptomyces sp. NBC_01373]
MLSTPPEVLAALQRTARRPRRAEWSNDGGRTWVSVPKVGETGVSPDRTAECRYSATAELLGVPLGRSGINTVVTQVRLWQGIAGPRMDPYWFPAGSYVVDRARRTRTGVAADLLGLEDAVRSASFPTTRSIGPDTAAALVPVLVGEALPNTPVSWRAGVNGGTVVPRFVADQDRWQALSGGADSSGVSTGITPALAAECYVDARGVFTVAPVPTLADPVVWRIPYGLALVEPAEEQSAEGLVNVWAISGDGGDGAAAVGPVFVWDDDPNSLTYAGPDPIEDPLAPQRLGLTGVRVRVDRYTSPLITSEAQAYAVGQARLADSLGVQSSLSFTAVCHPGLEPGDVVEVEVRPGEWQRHIIDSCPYSLGGVSMSCKTRTTTRRLTT